VELSIDSKAVVHVISTEMTQGAEGHAIVKKIRRLLTMEWNMTIVHEYREANKCVDALANIGCNLEHEVIYYEACPEEIRNILVADELGITTLRLGCCLVFLFFGLFALSCIKKNVHIACCYNILVRSAQVYTLLPNLCVYLSVCKKRVYIPLEIEWMFCMKESYQVYISVYD
jgi:hypothetical protein